MRAPTPAGISTTVTRPDDYHSPRSRAVIPGGYHGGFRSTAIWLTFRFQKDHTNNTVFCAGFQEDLTDNNSTLLL